jgi:hypothetical protein
MKSMTVLLGDESDPGSGEQSYRIALPAQIREVIHQVYPSPDGAWRRKGSVLASWALRYRNSPEGSSLGRRRRGSNAIRFIPRSSFIGSPGLREARWIAGR